MRSDFFIALAAAGLAAAAPASAYWVPEWHPFEPVVLEGDLFVDYAYQSLHITNPGQYYLDWRFDRPLGLNSSGEQETVVIHYGMGWISESYENGEWLGAASEVFEDYIVVTTSGRIRLTVAEPEIHEDWPLAEVTWEWIDFISLYAGDGWVFEEPVGFRLTLSQVPEPANWAMMIIGFGFVGSALRRRPALAWAPNL